MNHINHIRLTLLRQHARYGEILDRALKTWYDPLVPAPERVKPLRHSYGSYPGGDKMVGSSPKLPYAPCEKKACCLLGAARIGLPGSFLLFSSALGISTEEVTAITAGFDAENEPELESAIFGFAKHAEAVRFGHCVAVELGLSFDDDIGTGNPVTAAFVAIIDSHTLIYKDGEVPTDCDIDGVPALLTIFRTAKGIGVSLPGGKVDPGESAADTAVREIYEEIGAIVHKRDLTVLGTWNAEGQPRVTYVVDIAHSPSVRLDVETKYRVYTPAWHPYTVLGVPGISAFPTWGAECCQRLKTYLDSSSGAIADAA